MTGHVAPSPAFTAGAYLGAFYTERANVYPEIDALENELGHAVDRARLEEAARVLACPLKPSKPNWQHGRVLYACARAYFHAASGFMNVLDIGSAKGFSALCLQWAMADAGRDGEVVSVDVIDPIGRVRRNTVAEVDGYLTLPQTLEPWPEARAIRFAKSTGIEWMEGHLRCRINVAFVDGKHTGEAVRREGILLAARQQTGDLAIFDDVHITDVSVAVASLHSVYRIQYLEALPTRQYAIARRR